MHNYLRISLIFLKLVLNTYLGKASVAFTLGMVSPYGYRVTFQGTLGVTPQGLRESWTSPSPCGLWELLAHKSHAILGLIEFSSLHVQIWYSTALRWPPCMDLGLFASIPFSWALSTQTLNQCRLWSLSPLCLHSVRPHKICSSFFFPENASRQKTRLTIRLRFFVSFLIGISLLHCSLPNVSRQFSSLWQDNESGASNSIMACGKHSL